MLKLNFTRGRYYYSVFWNPVPRVMKFQRFADYFTQLTDGNCILDYGAGDRPLEPMLRTRFRHYVAADYLATNVAHDRRPDIPIVDNRVDLNSGSVDCVVLTEVMEHLYEPKVMLREIHRLLKPGGSVIGTVPFAVGEHEAPHDFYRYTSYCLRRMFEESGFKIVKLDYVGDRIGVAVTGFCQVMGIFTKALHKLRLAPLANIAQLVIRLPELVYYTSVCCGLDPGRIRYYRSYPYGFAFHLNKPQGKQ